MDPFKMPLTFPKGTELGQPDEKRCALAIANLHKAFEQIRSHPGGAETIGLGAAATADMAAVQAGLATEDRASDLKADTDAEARIDIDADAAAAPSGLLVSTRGLLHDLITSMHLPNRDIAIRRRMQDLAWNKKGLPKGRVHQTYRRLLHQLQWSTVTFLPDRIRLRNRVGELEGEVSAPALMHATDIPAEGISFELRFYTLLELFDRTNVAIPPALRWSHNGKQMQDELVYFRYQPARQELKIVDNGTRLRLTVKPCPMPEPPLAELVKDAEARPCATTALAEALRWTLVAGSPDRNVLQSDKRVASNNHRGAITVRNDDIDAELLVIGSSVAEPLAGVLRRFEPGTIIRSDGGHNYLTKDGATIAFAVARDELRDLDISLDAAIDGAQTLTLADNALQEALMIMDLIGAAKAHVQIIRGPHPKLRMTGHSVSTKMKNNKPIKAPVEAKAVHYAELDLPLTAEFATAFTIDVRLWINLLGGPENKRVTLLFNEQLSYCTIDHKVGERHVRAHLAVTLADPEANDADDQMVAAPSAKPYFGSNQTEWIEAAFPASTILVEEGIASAGMQADNVFMEPLVEPADDAEGPTFSALIDKVSDLANPELNDVPIDQDLDVARAPEAPASPPAWECADEAAEGDGGMAAALVPELGKASTEREPVAPVSSAATASIGHAPELAVLEFGADGGEPQPQPDAGPEEPTYLATLDGEHHAEVGSGMTD